MLWQDDAKSPFIKSLSRFINEMDFDRERSYFYKYI